MPLFRHKKSIIDGEEIAPGRLETLVDGIFAIAMTLLVFNIHLPEGALSVADLPGQLWMLWPKIFSFAVSFIILGMFWVAHHTEFTYIKKIDHKLIWLNMLYLLGVSFLPFAASLMGSFIASPLALSVYGINLIFLVISHFFIWRHAALHKNLIKEGIDPRINRLVSRLTVGATVSYVLAIGLGFWHVEIALVIFMMVPLPYIFGWVYRI